MPSQRRRRQPTANLFDTDLARAVNSQMVRTTRHNRKNNPLPNLTNLNASTPRQVRNILKQDVKDARARMIDSASSAEKGKQAFWADADMKKQRHVACGSANGKKALRFLTPGSRDMSSNVLPGCYYDPKGSRIRKGRGLAVPLIRRHYQYHTVGSGFIRHGDALYGGTLSNRDLEPYLLRLLHIRARIPSRFTSAMQTLLEDAQHLQRMEREGFTIDPTLLQNTIRDMSTVINNFPTGHQESKE